MQINQFACMKLQQNLWKVHRLHGESKLCYLSTRTSAAENRNFF
jgi:hypothetical protein